MATVLIPLPCRDFDPTEAAVPWRALSKRGHRVVFATPRGQVAEADPRMLFGVGLGLWRRLLQAEGPAIAAYRAMAVAPEFVRPRSYAQAQTLAFDALVLPGGHAPGMREYLESPVVHGLVARAFERHLPVAAICHGVVAVARAKAADGRSVLCGRRTTALTRALELSGWALTALWLGNYYRTYPVTVQAEVTAALADPRDFVSGPLPLRRDSPAHLHRGFVVRHGHYLSARWPGDAYAFAAALLGMLDERSATADAGRTV